GSTAGVISVEDVLEQLVGELEDEFDVASTQPAVTDANAPLVLDGAVNIRDVLNFRVCNPASFSAERRRLKSGAPRATRSNRAANCLLKNSILVLLLG